MRFPAPPTVRLGRALGALVVVGAIALSGCTQGSGPSAPGAGGPGSSAPGNSASAPTASDSGSAGTPSSSPSASTSKEPEPRQLPRGGTEIFPTYRLVGYSGAPNAPGQGRLGVGNLNTRVVEMERRAAPYKDGRKILPVMELIATTVHGSPGKDGMYRTRIEDKVIRQWLAVARKHKAILLLNIQPGRADFIDEVKAYEKWLAEPDVGLALDPEWAVDKGETPGRVFGSTSGKELNQVADWTAKLVAAHDLPQKVLLYHQLHSSVVSKERDLKAHKGVVLIKSIDGIGPPGAKVELYRRIIKTTPTFVHPGFKLFYSEDGEGSSRVMKASEVMALKPRPDYVLYE